MIRYKLGPELNMVHAINGESWTPYYKGSEGWDKYKEWESDGNVVEPFQTDEEKTIAQLADKRARRKAAYEVEGLTWELLNELIVEEDETGLADFRARRLKVRNDIS